VAVPRATSPVTPSPRFDVGGNEIAG
jgi:hypothetical protein